MERHVNLFPNGMLQIGRSGREPMDLREAIDGQSFTGLRIDGRLTGLDALAELTHLRELEFRRSGIESLDFLEHYKRLAVLGYFSGSLKSLWFGRTAKTLRELSIGQHRSVTDASAVEQCVHLTDLRLWHLPNLKVWPDLSKLKKLERLQLWNCRHWPSVKALRNLARLEQLSFNQTKVDDGDWTPLVKMKRLKVVFRFKDAFGQAAAAEFAAIRPDVITSHLPLDLAAARRRTKGLLSQREFQRLFETLRNHRSSSTRAPSDCE